MPELKLRPPSRSHKSWLCPRCDFTRRICRCSWAEAAGLSPRARCMRTRRSSVLAWRAGRGERSNGCFAAIRYPADLGTIPCRKPGETLNTVQPLPTRRIRERTGEEVQVNARAAHCSGLTLVPSSDPGLGQVFWAQTSYSPSAGQPAGTNGARNPGNQQSELRQLCEHWHGSFQRDNHKSVWRCRNCNSDEGRHAGTHHRCGERPLSRGILKPRRGGEELAAQEIYGRREATAHSRFSASRRCAADRWMAICGGLER